MIVTVRTTLDEPLDVVWAAVKTTSAFLYVTRGFFGLLGLQSISGAVAGG